MSNVRDFGARGDGKTDDSKSIAHTIEKGDGEIYFPRGDYLIARSLEINLQQHGRIHVRGHGGTARLIMAAAGPALHLVGSHLKGSALPASINDKVWSKERMPMVRDLEIVGQHALADGVRIEGAMQPTLQGLLIRRCRHGVILNNRDRNVLIANCHIYDNTGIGIFFDGVNLHQTIIEGNHVSYCKQGGIKIAGSEIRNLQICSNDIEYNHDLKATQSADVLFDCRNGTVREGTLVGNTIQAVQSPGGANVRFIGAGATNPNAVGLWAITGNLIGSQTTAIDLVAGRGISITGNSIYSGYQHALRAENCEHLVIGANSIDHNPEYKGNSTDRLVFHNCRNVMLSGVVLQHTRDAVNPVSSSIEVRACENIDFSNCQIINARVRGIELLDSNVVRVASCTIRGRANDKTYRTALSVNGNCARIMASNNFLGRGSDGDFQLPAKLGTASGNAMI